MAGGPRLAVIGIGNDYRHDDAVGPEAARQVRRAGLPGVEVMIGPGDNYALLASWQGCQSVHVVDCTLSGAVPGTIRSFDARRATIPTDIFAPCSTHTLNLASAVELARTLGKLPRELTIYGVEGADFSHGRGLTAAVRAAVDEVAGRIIRSCESVSRRRQRGSRHA